MNVRKVRFTDWLLIFFIPGIVISPFVFWPWAPIPFEIPRVWFILRWVEILGVLGIIYSYKIKPAKSPSRPLYLGVCGFLLASTFSSIIGADFTKSLLGNYYRSDGLMTLFHLCGLAIFLSLCWQKSWKSSFSIGSAVGSLSVSIMAIMDSFRLLILHDGNVSNWYGIAEVSFGQPNFLGGYLLVTLPFVWYLRENNAKSIPSKTALLIFIFIQMIAILLTFSVGSILGIFLLFVILLLRKFNRLTYRNIIFSAIGFLSLLLAVFLWQANGHGFVAESRERIIPKIFLGALKRPIWGWGLANVDYAFKQVAWPYEISHDVYLDKAHSILLEVFTTTGIVGLTVYLFLIINLFRKLIMGLSNSKESNWYFCLLLVIILYLFHSQTNVISIAEELFFWLILGIAANET